MPTPEQEPKRKIPRTRRPLPPASNYLKTGSSESPHRTDVLNFSEGSSFEQPKGFREKAIERAGEIFDSTKGYKTEADNRLLQESEYLIKKKHNLTKDGTEIILAPGSAAMLERAIIALIPGPTEKSHIWGMSPYFPFFKDAVTVLKDTNKKGSQSRMENIETPLFSSANATFEEALRMNSQTTLDIKRPVFRYMCLPTTPTGEVPDEELVRKLIESDAERGTIDIIDAAFADWVPEINFFKYVEEYEHLLLVNSNKSTDAAQLRIGYGVTRHRIAEIIRNSFKYNPFTVPRPNQIMNNILMQAALDTDHMGSNIIPKTIDNKAKMTTGMRLRGFTIKRSHPATPIFLAGLPTPNLTGDLLEVGIKVGDGNEFASTHEELRSDDHFSMGRFTVPGDMEDINEFFRRLDGSEKIRALKASHLAH